MADKHVITLEILREYGTDLSIPREVEFNIVSLATIDASVVEGFAARFGWRVEVESDDSLFMATLKAKLVITEESIRELSEAVERSVTSMAGTTMGGERLPISKIWPNQKFFL